MNWGRAALVWAAIVPFAIANGNGMPFPRVKGHPYEEACRMPFVVCWPGGVARPGRRVNAFQDRRTAVAAGRRAELYRFSTSWSPRPNG